MLSKKCYFVEDYDPGLDYTDGIIVALTPESCYALSKAGISYKIVEDFYSEKTLRYGEDRYFYDQLDWFKRFDRIFKSNIVLCREHNINLPRGHFLRLKYFIDSMIVRARMLEYALSAVKPDNVIYVCAGKEEDLRHDIYEIYDNKRRFFKELSILICKKYGISISIKYGAPDKKHSVRLDAVKGSVKKFLKKLRLKSIFYFFKYEKYTKLVRGKKKKHCLNLLVLHAGWLGMDIIIKKSIASGANLFFRDEDKIVLISGIIQREVLDLHHIDTNQREKISRECLKVFNDMVAEQDIVEWINDKCAIDVSGLIMPYLKYFIENICSRNILEILSLIDFYNEKKIDMIVARSSSEDDSVSVFLAADDKIKKVCFQHGIMYETIASITELDLVDYYFAMDGLSEQFFKDRLKLDYVSKCRVSQSSHYMKAVREKIRSARKPGNFIMYVPTRIFPSLNVFNLPFYTLTWYYELQKAVLDCLGSAKNKNFIYKGTTVQEWFDNTMLLHIKKRGYDNIQIEKRPLVECMEKAERAIFDYPSTGFYESAVSGIPAMSLCHDTFAIDDQIMTFFGKSIQTFSTIPEAIKKMADFIDAKADDYLIDIPLSDGDPVDALLNIKYGKN